MDENKAIEQGLESGFNGSSRLLSSALMGQPGQPVFNGGDSIGDSRLNTAESTLLQAEQEVQRRAIKNQQAMHSGVSKDDQKNLNSKQSSRDVEEKNGAQDTALGYTVNTDADDVNLAYSYSSPNLSNMDSGKPFPHQSTSEVSWRSRSSSLSQTISQSLSGSDDQVESATAFPLSQSFDFDGDLRANMSPEVRLGRSVLVHESTLSASARRILSSASFDSDYSDGALGAEKFNFDSGESDSHSRSFSASDEEEGGNDNDGVREFDEFADFNEFEHHYDREKGRSASSAELHRIMSNSSLDDSSIDSPRSPHPLGTNKNASHELTCKQLVMTVLATELLFAPTSTTPSPGKQTNRKTTPQKNSPSSYSPHPSDRDKHHTLSAAAKTSAHLAASFFNKSRNSIIGSLSHLGINPGSSGTVGSDLSAENDSILTQNLTNAAASVPKAVPSHPRPPRTMPR